MKKIYHLLALIWIGTFLNCVSTSGSTSASLEGNFRVHENTILDRASELGADVGEGLIEGTASNTHILFLFWGDTNKVNLSNVMNEHDLPATDSATTTAASNAVISNKVDAIYITRVVEETTGFFPFFWKTKTIVKGKPITFKSLGPMSDERLELRRTLAFKRNARNRLFENQHLLALSGIDFKKFPSGLGRGMRNFGYGLGDTAGNAVVSAPFMAAGAVIGFVKGVFSGLYDTATDAFGALFGKEKSNKNDSRPVEAKERR